MLNKRQEPRCPAWWLWDGTTELAQSPHPGFAGGCFIPAASSLRLLQLTFPFALHRLPQGCSALTEQEGRAGLRALPISAAGRGMQEQGINIHRAQRLHSTLPWENAPSVTHSPAFPCSPLPSCLSCFQPRVHSLCCQHFDFIPPSSPVPS